MFYDWLFIRFGQQFDKHGNYYGFTDCDSWINSLSNVALVKLMDEYLDETENAAT